MCTLRFLSPPQPGLGVPSLLPSTSTNPHLTGTLGYLSLPPEHGFFGWPQGNMLHTNSHFPGAKGRAQGRSLHCEATKNKPGPMWVVPGAPAWFSVTLRTAGDSRTGQSAPSVPGSLRAPELQALVPTMSKEGTALHRALKRLLP